MDDAESSKSNTRAEINEDGYNALRDAGIEPRVGLPYCQNDEEFYRSLLAEYAHVKDEKSEMIRKSFDEEDWHNYAIYVHALKSTSKLSVRSCYPSRQPSLRRLPIPEMQQRSARNTMT